MAIPVLSGFEINSANPVDERFIMSKAQMLAKKDSSMPEKYFCICSDDGKIYTYNKANTPSETTGKFKVFEGGGGSGGTSDYNELDNKPKINNVVLEGEKSLEDLGIETTWGSITGTLDDQSDLKDKLDEISDSIPNITIKKEETAEEGFLATYKLYNGDTAVGDAINLPKDYLVKSAERKVCDEDDNPVEGYKVGDKYIDFIINTKDGSGTDSHLYISLADLGGSGASTASEVSYANASYTTWTDVQKAIDGILDKIDYVKPTVSSFTMTPSTDTYEIGQSVTSLSFTWSYNKAVTSQTLTDVTLTDETDRSGTWTGTLTTNKTFTLSASDGKNNCSSSKTISFKNKLYYGSSATQETYDSAFILALSNKQFATAKKGSYTMTIADSEYGFIAFPKSFGTLSSVYIGGFEVTVEDCGIVSFTNASGGTADYYVYRTGRSGLGTITMEVK